VSKNGRTDTADVSGLTAWLLAARPKTLPASVGPVLVGMGAAHHAGVPAWTPSLACLAVALGLQIAVNLANDYFDFGRGIDTSDRVGPRRATASGLIAPWKVKWAMIASLALTLIPGGYLVWIGGAPIALAALLAILGALTYSGGPWPLASHGLGDPAVFLFFGPVAVVGTYYVQALAVSAAAVWASLPVGLLITAILVVNNYRDIDTDRRAGKRTLAVRLGRTGSRIEFSLLTFGAQALVIPAWLAGPLDAPVLLTLAALPACVALNRELAATTGTALNRTLARTAGYSLLFCLLLAAGLVLGG
jgi:1,4-dihydroxy-2-naphthoate octaprenyltransferase